MAVFSAIGAAIASALGMAAATGAAFATIAGIGLTFTGTLVAGVVAAGLGMATAKVLGINKPQGIQQSKDPGVKIQLSPSTDRRVPVLYGQVHTGGIIVDAEIKNQNKTMVYCMVIGEKTDSGAYTIQSIRRNDQLLNFTGGYASATSGNVISVTDPNGTSTNNVANKLRVRVFAGNAQSSVNQIFPPGGTKVAAQTLMTTITAQTNYEDLVYAIFELDYDVDESLTSLQTITYQITNSLSEPSNVLLDYCRNERYGAGLTNAELDLPSFNELYNYSTAQVAYTTNLGAAATHDRWKIDGMLSTYQPVKDNIDQICQNASTYFTYDNKVGKFTVVPNRPATTAEKNAAYTFTDDNIISSIEITSTELYSLYNSIESEYPSVEQKDQTKVIIVTTPSGDRNTNEPDNPLQTRYNLTNDAPRVHNLANIDLRQSRTSTLISFSADYSSLVVDVGDIIKVTNSVYGFSAKLFRVMKVSEIENDAGYLSAKFTCLEYADSIYAHNTVQSDGVLSIPGIPGWTTGIWGNIDYGNISNIIGNITIVDDPVGGGNANIVDPPTGNIIGNIDYANIDFTGIGGFGGFTGTDPFINFPITIPNIPGISHIDACVNPIGSSVSSNVANSNPGSLTPIRPPLRNGRGRGAFDPGEIVNVSLPMPVLPPADISAPTGPLLPDILANIDFTMFGGFGGFGGSTIKATAPNVSLAPKGTLGRGNLGDVQAGLQIDEDVANVNTASSSTVQNANNANVQLGTANSIISPVDVIDLGGIDEGIYSAINGLTSFGGFTVGSAIAYSPQRAINYDQVNIGADGTFTKTGTTVTDVAGGSGNYVVSSTSAPIPPLSDNFDYEISRARGGIVAAGISLPPISSTLSYIPANVNVFNFANSNLVENAANGLFRGFDVTNADKRISKADAYRIPRFGGCFIAGSMVLMADGGWKEIEFVVIGEKVIGLNGVTNTVTKLHHYPVAQQVICTIDNSISLTDTHPMLTVEGWKSFRPELTAEMHPDIELAGKLMIGDTLITHTGPAGLYNYTKKVQDIPVYNLDVDGDDTFIVDGYVVHNK